MRIKYFSDNKSFLILAKLLYERSSEYDERFINRAKLFADRQNRCCLSTCISTHDYVVR